MKWCVIFHFLFINLRAERKTIWNCHSISIKLNGIEYLALILPYCVYHIYVKSDISFERRHTYAPTKHNLIDIELYDFILFRKYTMTLYLGMMS